MRISDWSSDVCSSDLVHANATVGVKHRGGLAEMHDAGLRSVIGIGGIARHADTRERGAVDDADRSGRQHRRPRIFHPEHSTGTALAERIGPGLHVHGLPPGSLPVTRAAIKHQMARVWK